jgi:O-antigen/teichoic acid export membrane protein
LPPSDSRRLVRNIAANWAWYALVLASGFVLPRLVDEFAGQAALGVWDFGWSLVIYVNLLALGVASAVNRYVARFRAVADWQALNEHVSTCLLLLSIAGTVGLGLAGAFAWLAPRLLHAEPDLLRVARLVVLLLGINSALQLPGGVFNGVLTGCERFDVLNWLRGVRDVVALAVSVVLLTSGFGLVALAAAVLVVEGAGELAKIVLAFRVCPQMRISLRLCRRRTLQQVLGFGSKCIAQSAASAGIYQGTSVLVGIFLGPAALAVFARQRALVMHVYRFVKQYAQVFVPRSSALEAGGELGRLRHTLTQSSRFGAYVTVPLLALLILLGGPLLELWMGPAYDNPAPLIVLAAGHLLSIPQLAASSLLTGLGRHGRPALFDLTAAALSLAAGALVLGPLGGGLTAAAVTLTVPVTLSAGILTPWYACRTLGLPIRRYVLAVWPRPLLLAMPGAIVMGGARLLSATPAVQLVLGVTLAGLVTALLYWRWAIPSHWRTWLLSRCRERLGLSRVPPPSRLHLASQE